MNKKHKVHAELKPKRLAGLSAGRIERHWRLCGGDGHRPATAAAHAGRR